MAPTHSQELEAQFISHCRTKTTHQNGKDKFIGDYKPGIGKANVLKKGKDILLIGIGQLFQSTSSAILERGIKMAVASMGSIKPLDIHFLEECIQGLQTLGHTGRAP